MVWIEKSVTRVTDRHHEDCRVMPNSDTEWWIFLSISYTHNRYFFLHTFRFITFDFQSITYSKVTLFPIRSFYSSLKRLTLPATAVRFFTFTSNLHKVTSFFDVMAVKTNLTWRRRYVTSNTTNALNSRDFYPVLGEITWVIRFVGTGETRGYPYPVCQKFIFRTSYWSYARLAQSSPIR